jgi:hypothetical protein
LRSDGAVVAWGNNGYGQCNVPSLPSGLRYESVAGGVYHSLALRSDGAVVAWGYNGYGQCNVPSLPSGLRYESVAGGRLHSLALRSDGAVVAWGWNNSGQCNVPSLPSGLSYESVAAGGYEHSLALIGYRDCDQNGINDDLDIAAGAPDCNSNFSLDLCEIAGGFSPDCNFNNIPDSCDIATSAADCNLNGTLDACDVSSGASLDANFDNIPDECSTDCNNNGLFDSAEIAAGLAFDCNGNQLPDVCEVGLPDCDNDLIPDACELASGAPDCDADQLPDNCEPDANLDLIPDDCQDGGTPYCFGVGPAGGGAPCPCGNIGTAGNGCPNSQNPGGARLEAVGLPSRVADSLILRGSGMPPVATMLYFQGTLQSTGAAFGDGLRCVNGFVVRLGYRTNVNGASQIPSGGSAALHTAGQIPATGAATRYYQGWYRDQSPTFCTSLRYNLTNGVAVVWVP